MSCNIHDKIVKREKRKILIIGDSITNDGKYISYMNTHLKLYDTGYDYEIRNLGVAGETCSGLSEPSHQFVRPNVHARIEKVLEKLKPDLVIVFYGVNEGLYQPLTEYFFCCFQQGLINLVEKIKKFGAKAIVLTPPVFDANSFENELADYGESKYDYTRPYKNYDEVMKTYAEWVKNELKHKADLIVDIYTEMKEDIVKNRLMNVFYSSGDGIHPNSHGHCIIAKKILKDVFYTSKENFEEIMRKDDYRLFKIIYKRDMMCHYYDIESIGHGNPYNYDYLPSDGLEIVCKLYEEQISKHIKNNHELFYL